MKTIRVTNLTLTFDVFEDVEGEEAESLVLRYLDKFNDAFSDYHLEEQPRFVTESIDYEDIEVWGDNEEEFEEEDFEELV